MAAATVHATDHSSHVCAHGLFKGCKVPAQIPFVRMGSTRWNLLMLFPALCVFSFPIMGSHLCQENPLPGLTHQEKVQLGQAFFISGDHNPD
jgi:hypothetical protein